MGGRGKDLEFLNIIMICIYLFSLRALYQYGNKGEMISDMQRGSFSNQLSSMNMGSFNAG